MARRLFSVSPNGTDPETVFSELGRLLVPARRSFSDAQASQMTLISQDVRTQEREKIETALAAGTRAVKSNSEKDRAIASLKKCEAVFSGKTLVEKLRGPRTSNMPADVNAGDGETNEVEITAEFLGNENRDVAEGVEPIIDEELTDRAVLSFAQFKNDLLGVMETDDIEGGVANEKASVSDNAEHARAKSFEAYKSLPDFDDPNVPEDVMGGFRGAKVTLSKLFNSAVIGLLPPVSKFGHF